MVQKVDKKSAVPAYQQLKRVLLEQIKSGIFKPGEQIPSESQMCQHYSVSRITVRQAINSLVNDGLLFSAPGKGTFLKGIIQEEELEYIESFQSEARKKGFSAQVKVLEEAVEPADKTISEHLRIKEGEKIIRIKRVKIADNVPLCIELRFIPHKFCPDLVEEGLSGESLTELVKTRYCLNIRLREITVLPITLTSESVMLLKTKEGAPGLLVTEALLFGDSTPFKWEQRIHKSGLHFTNRAMIK
ncbi:MAG: GntR family transcriptional regulator [Candidatus Ratteibacteria bacterium]|jgi:GntR family transcriptional regulator